MSDVTELINSRVVSMEDVFKKNHFSIPFYQRDYAWESAQINDLWNDLMDVVDGHQQSHFFGQIVTYNRDNVKDLIDGQQRITTSSVLMAAINKVAKELKDNDLNQESTVHLIMLEEQIRNNVMYDELRPALKLQPVNSHNDAIHDYFIGLFNGIDSMNENNKKIVPVQNLHRVFKTFYERITKYLRAKDNIAERIALLEHLFESFMDKFFVSMISAKNQEDAFVIFETLNSRGKDLLPSEIIKTHLMSQISQENDDVKAKFNDTWQNISAKFDKDSDKLTKFIRIYWAASHRLVSTNQLYRSISNQVHGLEDTKNFLRDINQLVDYYLAVDHGNKDNKDRAIIGNDQVMSILNLMRKMQITLHYPIVFSMRLKGMNDSDVVKVLYKVLCVFMRHRAICMYTTNNLETGYASIAQKIWKQAITTPVEINRELDDKLLISDVNVAASFQALQKEPGKGAKNWTLKYMLFRFYQENGDFDGIHLGDVDINKYDLVHIADEEAVDANYLNYVGNYALLENHISQSDDNLSNKLAKSRLSTNQKLGQYIGERGWDVNDILRRQSDFADMALNIW